MHNTGYPIHCHWNYNILSFVKYLMPNTLIILYYSKYQMPNTLSLEWQPSLLYAKYPIPCCREMCSEQNNISNTILYQSTLGTVLLSYFRKHYIIS